jgi:hypothetical protein
MERQQILKKSGHTSSTNLGAAMAPADEPRVQDRMKYMNLQNLQVRRMPSTENRVSGTTADRVKAANN